MSTEHKLHHGILVRKIGEAPESHLEEEDADEDEEGGEEDGPLAELQERLAAETPHFQLNGRRPTD